jgi:tetratricopeptide (TPR) repeat protein
MSVAFGTLALVGGLALLRSNRAGFRALYLGAVCSLFLWPIPGVPVVNSWLHQRWADLSNVGQPLRLMQAMNLLFVVALIIVHVLAARNDPSPRQPFRLRLRPLALAAGLVAVMAGWIYCQLLNHRAAMELAVRGYDAFDAGRVDEALAEWQEVRARYPYTSSWGCATFNSAFCHQKQGEFQQAMAYYEELLSSELNDKDHSGNLMSPYQNYHHSACVQLSACCEAMEDYPVALHYARLAQTRYPYRSWCGTCHGSAARALHRRIERLENQVAGIAVIDTDDDSRHESPEQ